MEIKLPDYLPSRYKNWLDFYQQFVEVSSNRGFIINEETKVCVYDCMDYHEREALKMHEVKFYQEFPLIVIKARALDYILSESPSYEDILHLKHSVLSTHLASVDLNKILNGLLNVATRKNG